MPQINPPVLKVHSVSGMKTTQWHSKLGVFFTTTTLALTACTSSSLEGSTDDLPTTTTTPATTTTAPSPPSETNVGDPTTKDNNTTKEPSTEPNPSLTTHHSPVMIYTVSGTFVGSREGYAAEVGMKVDPSLYIWEPINYPASPFPMNASIDWGVAALVNQISAHPGKFALVGFSQGAIVVSKVYDLLRSGSLKSRKQDFIAGVAMGNPMREAGHTIPGGTDPGGHGIMGVRLTGSENLWWDFCAPNDTACTVGDDPAGRGETAIVDILMSSFTGQADIIPLVLRSLTNPLTALQEILFLTEATQRLLGFITGTIPDGHGAYPITHPIPGNPLTSIELAVQHLNETAAKLP